MGWLAAENRIRHNDIRLIQAYNADTDRRRVRRDLSDDELARIIAAARSGPASFGMTGEARAMAYATAAGTGFRASELASFTPASFRLDDNPPAITVNAAYSKRRRDDQQPIDPALAKTLKKWLADKPAGEKVFSLPTRRPRCSGATCGGRGRGGSGRRPIRPNAESGARATSWPRG